MRTKIITRGLLVAVPIAALIGGVAISPASADTTTTKDREILKLANNGWYSNSPVTTTVNTDVTNDIRHKSEVTTETRTVAGNTAQVLPLLRDIPQTEVTPSRFGCFRLCSRLGF